MPFQSYPQRHMQGGLSCLVYNNSVSRTVNSKQGLKKEQKAPGFQNGGCSAEESGWGREVSRKLMHFWKMMRQNLASN